MEARRRSVFYFWVARLRFSQASQKFENLLSVSKTEFE
jgi:hypothetical protein